MTEADEIDEQISALMDAQDKVYSLNPGDIASVNQIGQSIRMLQSRRLALTVPGTAIRTLTPAEVAAFEALVADLDSAVQTAAGAEQILQGVTALLRG